MYETLVVELIKKIIAINMCRNVVAQAMKLFFKFQHLVLGNMCLMLMFCLQFCCHLQQYQTLEHWYQPGEHQTACQPERVILFLSTC